MPDHRSVLFGTSRQLLDAGVLEVNEEYQGNLPCTQMLALVSWYHPLQQGCPHHARTSQTRSPPPMCMLIACEPSTGQLSKLVVRVCSMQGFRESGECPRCRSAVSSTDWHLC